MKDFSKMRLPRVKQSDVLEFMHAENISRLHLGKDPLPYLWYKKYLQMGKCGMIKYLGEYYTDSFPAGSIILAYCMATRKERREKEGFKKCYMTTMKILQLEVETDRCKKFIEENQKNQKKI